MVGKLSKQRKISLSVLGLLLLALVADRYVLSPEQVDADPSSAESLSGGAASAPLLDDSWLVDQNVQRGESLAVRLDGLAGERGYRGRFMPDAFAPSKQWIGEEEVEFVEPAPKADRAQRFIDNHQMTAVMAIGSGGYVSVNGEQLQIGQSIDGFTLISLGGRSAIFKSGDFVAELELSVVK